METYKKPFSGFTADYVESLRKYGMPTWPGLIVTKEMDKEIRSTDSGYRTCRESFIECINKMILNQKDYLTDKLRFGVVLNDKSIPRLGNGIKVLALYEEFAGFLPTEVYMMNIPKETPLYSVAGKNTFYIVASRRWYKSSYLLSLYLLLFRIAVKSEGFEDKDFASVETFEKKVRNLAQRRDNEMLSDYETCNNTIRNWQKILRNYKELFGKKTIVKNWTPSEWGITRSLGESLFRYEGISRLSASTSQNETLKAKFAKLE